MSKASTYSRKGTELRPRGPGIPAAIRFEGVEAGTPLERRLLELYAGEIDAFYNDRHIAYELSIAPLASNQRVAQRGDLRMTYQNLHGVESVFVKVSAKVLKTVKVETKEVTPKPERLPDFCVVDVIVLDSVDAQLGFASVGVEPPTFAGAREFDAPEGLGTSYSETVAGPLIRYSRNAPTSGGSVPIDNRVSSLKFDLRGIGPHGRVGVDLYGHVTPSDDDGGGLLPGIDDPGLAPGAVLDGGVIVLGVADGAADVFEDNHVSWPYGGTGTQHYGISLFDPLGNQYLDPEFPEDPNWLSFPDITYGEMFSSLIDVAGHPETTFVDPASLEAFGKSTYNQGDRTFVGMYLITGFDIGAGEGGTRFYWRIAFLSVPLSSTKDCDLAYAFYWDGQDNQHHSTPHADGSGIWATSDAVPSRRQLATGISVDSETHAGNPGDYQLLGRLAIDRGAATAKWTPA